ncbi:hypothetical protein FK220_015880 [Flavobacteriaceae bacterium TP-CH-4]|uniref:DKNYY family protein n=1 Tax=Pelagihabitans pacificus TaxID=2696054 RepID=A0A967AXA6_9FLAO|nr:DKNYY domain-containing protein [Pelagihabitans pacificus]NHF60835.1 hypothetical protein [Pelagihabitans pacificus]
MKLLFRTLFAPIIWLLQACNPLGQPVNESISGNHYFDHSKSDIRYSPMGNWFELGNSAMNADVESFEVFNNTIAKDKNRAYFESNAIIHPHLHLESFHGKPEVYMSNIGLDKNRVYTFNTIYIDGKAKVNTTEISGADPSTFEQLDFNWSKDSRHYFYRYRLVDVDYQSFHSLNDYFSTDKNRIYVHYYQHFEPLAVGDPKTFQVLDKSLYARDRNQVYYLSFPKQTTDHVALLRIPCPGEGGVVLLNPNYLKCRNKIYYNAIEVVEAQASDFEIISERYAKDKNNVYFENTVIPNADVASFSYDEERLAVIDKNGIYRNGKLSQEN